MKAKEITNRTIDLQNEIINAIVDMMNENNIALISFEQNGSSSDFDVDRGYAFVENYGTIEQREIIAVYTDGKNLFILPDNEDLQDETLNTLDENIIVYKDNKEVLSEVEKTIDDDEFYEGWCTYDCLFNPTDTLVDLLNSVEQTIESQL